MNEMSPETKRAVGPQLWLAALLVTAGLAIMGLSLAQIHAQNQLQMAQAPARRPALAGHAVSDPLRTRRPRNRCPGARARPRRRLSRRSPTTEAQKEGAKPALPPAPAEKMAPPIPEKK